MVKRVMKGDANWATILATNIAFRAAGGEAANGSVVLTNRIYVAFAPKSTEACAVSVAPGTLLAFRSQEGLKSICGEETDLQNFTVTKDWGLMWMSDEVFPSNTRAKVTVNVAKPLANDCYYTLIPKCVLADGKLPGLTVTGDAEALKPVTRSDGQTRLRLVLVDGALKLYAPPAGLVLLIR